MLSPRPVAEQDSAWLCLLAPSLALAGLILCKSKVSPAALCCGEQYNTVGRNDSHHFCHIPVSRSKTLGAASGRGQLREEMQADIRAVLENPKITGTSREDK